MTDDIYKALDICDKLDFFYGQRAGNFVKIMRE